jgi:hypothetical protein
MSFLVSTVEEREGVLCIEVHERADGKLTLLALFNVALTADIPRVLRELAPLAKRCAPSPAPNLRLVDMKRIANESEVIQ